MKSVYQIIFVIAYIFTENSFSSVGCLYSTKYRSHHKHSYNIQPTIQQYKNPPTLSSNIKRNRREALVSNSEKQIRGFISDIALTTLEIKSDIFYNLLGRSGNRVRFLLYNLKDPTTGENFVPDSPKKKTIWNNEANVKIIIHGYLEKGEEGILDKDPSSQQIKDDYMKMKRSENIVIIDWHSLSKEVNYYDAAKNTKIVGELVAEYIIHLGKHGYINSIKKIHIIGFSLGAQTAGIAGYFFQQKTGGKLPRITGLDPAGPGFEATVDLSDRLDKSDAEFVDVIHCDMGKPGDGQFGTELTIGTVDFFPNGGSVQPGCGKPSVIKSIFSGSCSHSYCPKLFEKSIRGGEFIGCPCKDWSTFQKGECNCGKKGIPMGESCCPPGTTGSYFLKATA